MMDRSIYIKAIVIGGLIGGLLSGIPVVSAGNCCCCMWVILGGVVASYVLVYSATAWPRESDAALVGMGSGALSGLITGIFAMLQTFIQGNEKILENMNMQMQTQNLPPEVEHVARQVMDMMASHFYLFMLAGTVIDVLIFAGLSTLGGYVGYKIFINRRFKQPPYGPPPGYGWPPQGPPQGPPPWQPQGQGWAGPPPPPWQPPPPQQQPPQQSPGQQQPWGQPDASAPPLHDPDDQGKPPGGGEPPDWGGQ